MNCKEGDEGNVTMLFGVLHEDVSTECTASKGTVNE
jgi:hypothetical protein